MFLVAHAIAEVLDLIGFIHIFGALAGSFHPQNVRGKVIVTS